MKTLIFNNKVKLLIFVMAGVLLLSSLLPLCSAEIQTLGTFKQNECVNLIQTCDNCSFVNITSLIYPNSTDDLKNITMEKRGTYYNYTFCKNKALGKYIYNTLGDDNGIATVQPVEYYINAIGFESTEASARISSNGIWFVLIIAVLFFIAFLFSNQTPFKYSFLLLFVLFIMIGVNIVSISIYNEIGNTQLGAIFDQMAAFSFIAYWFIGGLMIMIWTLTTIASIYDRKNAREIEHVGDDVNYFK